VLSNVSHLYSHGLKDCQSRQTLTNWFQATWVNILSQASHVDWRALPWWCRHLHFLKCCKKILLTLLRNILRRAHNLFLASRHLVTPSPNPSTVHFQPEIPTGISHVISKFALPKNYPQRPERPEGRAHAHGDSQQPAPRPASRINDESRLLLPNQSEKQPCINNQRSINEACTMLNNQWWINDYSLQPKKTTMHQQYINDHDASMIIRCQIRLYSLENECSETHTSFQGDGMIYSNPPVLPLPNICIYMCVWHVHPCTCVCVCVCVCV